MKKIIVATVAAFLALGFHAYRSFESETSDVLRILNVPESIAKNCIFYSFSGKYLSYPNPADLKKIASGDRAAIVEKVGEYAHAYSQSADFKKRYLEYRETKKPAPPETPKSTEQQKKEQRENLENAIRETENNMKSLPSETQATMKEVVGTLRQQLKSLDDPNNPMFSAQMEEMVKQGYEIAKTDYATKVAQWEKDYPLSPEGMIKSWLTAFLEVSHDIDYNAKLTKKDDKMVFINSAYEQKSSNWKLCYRAGKETVEAGRAFSAKWLKELGMK